MAPGEVFRDEEICSAPMLKGAAEFLAEQLNLKIRKPGREYVALPFNRGSWAIYNRDTADKKGS